MCLVVFVLSFSLLALALPTRAAGSHVSCGQVLTEDTALDSDLVDCPGDGLVIGADGVRVRLNDHTISGTSAPGSAGIRNAGHDRVVIEDGDFSQIRAFETGVLLDSAERNRVRGLSVQGDAYGIVVRDSSDSRIERNAARAPAITQCAAPERVGIALFDSHRNRVRDNVAELTDFGIVLAGSNENRIERNQAAPAGSDGNQCIGLALYESDANHLEDNVADHNDHEGIFVALGSSGTVVAGNVAEFNGLDDGIDVDDPDTTIARNAANFNGDFGIEAVPGVTDGGGNTATGNGNPLQCTGVECE